MKKNKFRVWDTKNNKWLETKNGLVFIFVPYVAEPILSFLYNEDYIVNQFTGQVDCQGTEIYEGDIVLLSDQYNLLSAHNPVWLRRF